MNNETHRITAIALSCYYNMMANSIKSLLDNPDTDSQTTIQNISEEMTLTLVAYYEQTGQRLF